LGQAQSAHEVKLRDKTKLKGYVSEAGEDSFVIVDEKTDATSTLAYAQVQQVKGNNLSKAAEIAIGVGVILLPIVMVFYFVSKSWSLLVCGASDSTITALPQKSEIVPGHSQYRER